MLSRDVLSCTFDFYMYNVSVIYNLLSSTCNSYLNPPWNEYAYLVEYVQESIIKYKIPVQQQCATCRNTTTIY